MSILITCDVGDSVTVRGTLTDEDGEIVTGAAVTAEALAPGETTPAALGAAAEEGVTGVYAVTYEPAEPGRHEIRFESAAPSKAAAEGVVYVRETRFA